MPQGKSSSRDFDALEAEIALALADPTLPMDKRREFEDRLEAIRAKAGVERSQ